MRPSVNISAANLKIRSKEDLGAKTILCYRPENDMAIYAGISSQ